MPFEKKCASAGLHHDWEVSTQGTKLTTKVTAAVRQKLLKLCGRETDYWKSHPSFCETCVYLCNLWFPETSAPSESSEKPEVPVESGDEPPRKVTKIEQLSTSHAGQLPLVQSQTTEIDRSDVNKAYELGASQYRQFKEITMQEARLKDIGHMVNFEEHCGFKDVETVIAFICGLTGQPLPARDLPNALSYQLRKTLESLMDLTSEKMILPLHLRESVILYALTGSRLALKIISAAGPHASYQAVKNWLGKLAMQNQEIPEGDVIITFDNNQVIQRRWRVKLKHGVQCNVVTIIVVFCVNENGELQFNTEYKPSQWSQKPLTTEEINELKFIDQNKVHKETHYAHLSAFLEAKIKEVASQQTSHGTSCHDLIDDEVQKTEKALLYKKCYNCNFAEVPKSKHTCPRCRVNLTKAKLKSLGLEDDGSVSAISLEESTDSASKTSSLTRVFVAQSASQCRAKLSYSTTDEQEVTGTGNFTSKQLLSPTVKVLEPAYVNPCGYEPVATVLRNIKTKCKIGDDESSRKWVQVVCDGIPYNLCRRIIRTFHLCSICKVSLDGFDKCAAHANSMHEGLNPTFQKEFDWVLLIPGAGHIEMNMLKGLVELLWDVIWKDLAICLNFRSESALSFCKKVNDHHKGWTLLLIARDSITSELIVPFVRANMCEDAPDLSVSAFIKFTMNATDPNYSFMCDVMFDIIDALFMFREGIRGGIVEFTQAALAKYAKLWSGRRHPLYRELEAAHHVLLARMPDEVRNFVLHNMSINTTGNPNTGEGADFRLEEVNKQIQFWLPNIPSPKDWKMVCCNYSDLATLRRNTFLHMDVKDPNQPTSRRRQDLSKEIVAFRAVIRKQKYLMSPHEPKSHKSLMGDPLDNNLVNFCKDAREKRALYIEKFLCHEVTDSLRKASPPAYSEPAVFITEQEREEFHSVANKTIVEIKLLISTKLEEISSESTRAELQSAWEGLKGRRSTKAVFLNFFNELEEYVRSDEQEEYINSATGDCDD